MSFVVHARMNVKVKTWIHSILLFVSYLLFWIVRKRNYFGQKSKMIFELVCCLSVPEVIMQKSLLSSFPWRSCLSSLQWTFGDFGWHNVFGYLRAGSESISRWPIRQSGGHSGDHSRFICQAGTVLLWPTRRITESGSSIGTSLKYEKLYPFKFGV